MSLLLSICCICPLITPHINIYFIFISVSFSSLFSSSSSSFFLQKYSRRNSMTSSSQASPYLCVCVCVYSSFSPHRENFSPVQSLVSLSPFTNRPPCIRPLVSDCTTVVFNRVSLSLHWLLLSLATSDIYSVNTGVTRDLLPIQQRLYRMFII